MPIIPANKLGRADDAGKVLARNAELTVVRSADGEDHRVIKVEQFGDGGIAADGDVADEINAIAFGDLVVAFANRLQRLVIGGHPETDEAVGHSIAIEDVNARGIAIRLLQRLGGVEARRSRADHREMPHPTLQCCSPGA